MAEAGLEHVDIHRDRLHGRLLACAGLIDHQDDGRAHMTRLDMWIQGFEPSIPQDLKMARRVCAALLNGLSRSYVGLDHAQIDRAVVTLCGVLAEPIVELHERFDLGRSPSLPCSRRRRM